MTSCVRRTILAMTLMGAAGCAGAATSCDTAGPPPGTTTAPAVEQVVAADLKAPACASTER